MNSIHKLGRGIALVFSLLSVALGAATLVSCASNTQMNGIWVNPEAGKRAPSNNVLVIGILPALYAAWFKVKRQPAPAQEAKEVVSGDPALV